MDLRKKIAIHLDTAFDVRQFVSTGMVKLISEAHDVLLFLRPGMIDAVKRELGDKVEYREVRYYKKGKLLPFNRFNRLRLSLHFFLMETFRLTYANLKVKNNSTRKFHLRTSKNKERGRGRRRNLFQQLAILTSNWMCQTARARSFMRKVRYLFATPNEYRQILREEKVSLVVTCSMGVDRDVFFMSEAYLAKIPIFVAIQSWDKTSTKGYPVVPIDKVSLWNHMMIEEVKVWHEIKPEDILVGGIPEWDHYFNKTTHFDKALELKKMNLDPLKKTIYFALCDASYHLGNMNLLRFLHRCLEENRFVYPTQFILRLPPKYGWEVVRDMYRELMENIEPYRSHPAMHFDFPINKENEKSYGVSNVDRLKVRMFFEISDACISILSTQMLEASIFDKPIITVGYGLWKSFVLEADMREVDYHHLEGVYNTGAVSKAKDDEDLLEILNSYLKNPEIKSENRKKLLDQVIPVHRGNAWEVISNSIISLAGK